MRPMITLEDLRFKGALAREAFEAIAELKHYKVLYIIMKEKKCSTHGGIGELLNTKEFGEACVEYVNRDENYARCFKELIDNAYNFPNLEVPTKNCDFKVVEGNSISYFWINERIEIYLANNVYATNKLIVDEKSNYLYYDLHNGDGLNMYKEDGSIGEAYKNWLAERELLR